MKRITNKQIIIDFLREGNMDLPNKTAAKKLFVKYPEIFTSIENARHNLRYVRGADGTRSKKGAIASGLYRSAAEINGWKEKLPTPDDDGFKVHQLPTTAKKWLLIFDLHSPYYDKEALYTTLKYGHDQGCDGLLLNEIADMYQCSFFCRDPRKRSIVMEADILKEIFEIIIDMIKPKSILWKLGNHEARLEKYIMVRSPELLGLSGLTFEEIFDCKKYKITIIPETDPIKYKSLTILHGHEYKGGFTSPVNPARGIYLKASDNVIIGHYHVTSEHTAQTINEKIITCWSVGCLCNLHPKYSPLNKWNHGFGILTTGLDKYWRFENKRIIENEVV